VLVLAVIPVVVAFATPHAQRMGASPAQLTATSRVTRHFEYVLNAGEIYIYSIDQHNKLVHTVSVPEITQDPTGVVASPATGRLYVSFGGEGGSRGNGSMLVLDLRREQVLWRHDYSTGVDSMAITPDGRTIYMPAGEFSNDGTWSMIDASGGNVVGAVHGPAGAHNTIMSLDGSHVYLGGVDDPYLYVASTATGKIVKKIGPLHGPGAGRPFSINGSQTLVFNTASSYLGFQVSSIPNGKVLYSVPVPGFTWDAQTFGHTPDHGISLSPDERELYLIDTPNGYVHVFDVSGLPGAAPREVADIKLVHAPPNDGWLQHSRDGRYVYVGRSGDVIDTTSRKVVAYLAPMQNTADFLEIDWRHGSPVATTNRYGVGYVRRR
jgi:DNA-binding beta-propeller fold protein YncE